MTFDLYLCFCRGGVGGECELMNLTSGGGESIGRLGWGQIHNSELSICRFRYTIESQMIICFLSLFNCLFVCLPIRTNEILISKNCVYLNKIQYRESIPIPPTLSNRLFYRSFLVLWRPIKRWLAKLLRTILSTIKIVNLVRWSHALSSVFLLPRIFTHLSIAKLVVI